MTEAIRSISLHAAAPAKILQPLAALIRDCLHRLRSLRHSDEVKLFGGFGQRVAELGMGETDQRPRALRRRQPFEIYRAELGHDVMSIDARRRHRTVEPRHDARDLALGRGRPGGDDRLAAFRAKSSCPPEAVY